MSAPVRAPASRSKRRKPQRWTARVEPRVSKRQVLGNRQRADDALVVPVLRNAADAGAAQWPAATASKRFAGQREGAGAGGRGHSGDRAGQRGLAITRNAGDADDLAGTDLQRRLMSARSRPCRRRHGHAIEHQQHVARRARLAAALRDLAPDHQGGERGAGRLPRLGRSATFRPRAQHRDAVGDRQHLA